MLPWESDLALVPWPAEVARGSGAVRAGGGLEVAVAGPPGTEALADLVQARWRVQHGPAQPGVDPVDVRLEVERAGPTLPGLDDDEHHELVVDDTGARRGAGRVVLRAPTRIGARRGLETLLQLARRGPAGAELPVVRIVDRPRFAWRGLLLDVCRHWMPPELVERLLDQMAAVKLNVLHLHLSEDQAFRIESRAFPGLHRSGSGGDHLTRSDVRRLVAHAARLGIRVVPELDVPGHVTSWLVAHPELASRPGPYALRTRFGVAEAALDPTRPEVDDFVATLVGELVELFPDPCFHVGGDEVHHRAWDDPALRARAAAAGLPSDDRGLQTAFNRRLVALLAGHGKRVVGWDEILHDDLPREVIVQSWRGTTSLYAAARAGHDVVASAGYYLDHCFPARVHHGLDPLAPPEELAAWERRTLADPSLAGVAHAFEGFLRLLGDPRATPPLTEEESARVLGGEACLWSELLTAENLEARTWPRAAAFAERLWSPREVRDDDGDLARRLDVLDGWLASSVGARHRDGRERMLARLGGSAAAAHHLRVVSDACEPLKFYVRHFSGDPEEPFAAFLQPRPPDRCPPGPPHAPYTTGSPLDRLVDATPPESATAARLERAADALERGAGTGAAATELAAVAAAWRAARALLRAPDGPARPGGPLAEIGDVLDDLAALAEVLDDVVAASTGGAIAPQRREVHEGALARAGAPCAELVVRVVAPVRRLLDAT